MSHFTVLVIGPDPAAQLQPFHEFECTGIDDEYVQDVDITDEVTEEFQKHRDSYVNIAEFVRDYHGIEHVVPTNTEPGEAGKYGYAWYMPGQPTNVVKVVRRTNPNAKWDWWVVGGRWCGFFPLREGAVGVAGQGAGAARGLRAAAGTADQLRVSDVDFDRARREAEERAHKLFDRWERLVAEHGKAEPWSFFRKCEELDKARAAYHAQPLVAASNKPEHEGGMGFRLGCWIDDLGYDRDAYVKRERDWALVPYAIVKDGKWFAEDEMGWFGCSDDKIEQGDWNTQVQRLYDDLPPDTLLTLVDCHI